ncbi:MAG: hypothetical protein JXR78_04435 [Victivallales bacterium]|nr:hypothetical protein [Victivallales bacterium]
MSSKQHFAYRSFWPELEAVRDFMHAGIDTICIFPANTMNSLGEPYCKYPANWLWFNRYDFSGLDSQIADILNVNPRAELLCMIDLNSPAWLSRQLSLMHECADSFTQLSMALSLPEWKRHTADYLRAFLSYAETHYAHIIKAYILACGHTDEWLDHSGGATGKAKAEAYRRWRKDRMLAEEAVPDSLELDCASFDEFLYNPDSQKNVIDYWHFSNELVADTILEFAEVARGQIRAEAEVGVFYGYVMDRIGPVRSGHADYERVLASPDIDFFISPGTYCDREIGGGSGFLTVSGSERLAGKKHMHECDQRTHTYNRNLSESVKLEFPCWPDTASDIAGTKREFALSLIEGSSLWWFDMWGGFYKERELLDNLAAMKKLWDRLSNQPYKSVAQTALIVDPDSLFYMLQSSTRQKDFSLNARKQLNRLGAPYDVFSLNDVPRIEDLDRYRFIIFSVPLEINTTKAELLRKHLLNGNRCVLWLYAPGISDGFTLDQSRVGEWTGVEYGTPGLQVKQMGTWTSAYLHRPAELTPLMLKDLAQTAGVHLYCEDELPVFANDRLLAIHCGNGGTREITLPCTATCVKELFSDVTAVKDGNIFRWDFNSPDTVLFEVIQ